MRQWWRKRSYGVEEEQTSKKTRGNIHKSFKRRCLRACSGKNSITLTYQLNTETDYQGFMPWNHGFCRNTENICGNQIIFYLHIAWREGLRCLAYFFKAEVVFLLLAASKITELLWSEDQAQQGSFWTGTQPGTQRSSDKGQRCRVCSENGMCVLTHSQGSRG